MFIISDEVSHASVVSYYVIWMSYLPKVLKYMITSYCIPNVCKKKGGSVCFLYCLHWFL
jgi:hypothetical protein